MTTRTAAGTDGRPSGRPGTRPSARSVARSAARLPGALLGLLCGRRAKWVVLAVWLGVVAVAGSSAAGLESVQKDDLAAYLPGSADSARAVERILGMQGESLAPATVVYERRGGVTEADEAAIARDLEELARTEGVVAELPAPTGGRSFDRRDLDRELEPYRDAKGRLPEGLRAVEEKLRIPEVKKTIDLLAAERSRDGEAVQVAVVVRDHGGRETAQIVERVRRVVDAGRPAGLAAHITGLVGFQADALAVFSTVDTDLLLAALGVAVVVLLVTYRSAVLWLLPLGAVLVGLVVAMGVNRALAAAEVVTVSSVAVSLLMVLVIGAGTDYALLIVARYREELRRHADRHEAMAVALRRAGPAVVASAATVVAGLLCLTAAELNSTKGLGPVSAVGVTGAMLAMMTLLPAVMVICGRWVFWPVIPRYDPHGGDRPAGGAFWGRLGRGIARNPRRVWLATLAVLAVCSAGLTAYREGGLGNADVFLGRPDSVVGQEVAARHFPAGGADPVQVVTGERYVRDVILDTAQRPEVTAITLGAAGNGDVLLNVTVRPSGDRDAERREVLALRDRLRAVAAPDVNVGGNAALMADLERGAERDRAVIIPLVLLVVFAVLALLLRSLVAPLLLLATVVVSFLATLGISALAFTHLFGFAGVDQGFVLLVFVFLVALGVDYNIFLMHRVREEAHRHGTARGAILGLEATGGVITSAGVVLAGTFAVLVVLPLSQTVQLAFAVAVGVLLDTMVVRSVLVTALTLDIGDAVWWPGRLSRGPARPPRGPARRSGARPPAGPGGPAVPGDPAARTPRIRPQVVLRTRRPVRPRVILRSAPAVVGKREKREGGFSGM
ncbi:MMPL family transporter [Planomonospora parontospora]|uniref:MMPL family transporter n=1 Tax=Planomonospora parontospora TaxID=58119 RepID=UPI00166F656F|nr:MMPL family transporter [Planomonospora parontospora]GGL51612.1 putative membrane protein ActII-3 [Planomonospora parontospora subsp. antibiotica]GII19386.1 putative membrane protein ActII-3 [Planomonospora parontospora subsp. antibiotica]